MSHLDGCARAELAIPGDDRKDPFHAGRVVILYVAPE